MEIPKVSNLTEYKNIFFSNENNIKKPNYYLNTPNLETLKKFPDAALNSIPSDYSNSTFNPEYFNRKNQREIELLENTVNSVYIPQENFDLKSNYNLYNSAFPPNKNANNIKIDSNIYDSNYNYSLVNSSENSAANNNNFTLHNTNNASGYNNNKNNNNLKITDNLNQKINNKYDFAVQNAESLLNKGYYELTENQTEQSKSDENLYAKFKSEHKEFPHLKDLGNETGIYSGTAQTFDYENIKSANLKSGFNLIAANHNFDNNKNIINKVVYYSDSVNKNDDIEKSFNYKIEEILEKRNQQIKLNLIESQNSQYASLLKEIDLLKQKNFELEDSNFKFKNENE